MESGQVFREWWSLRCHGLRKDYAMRTRILRVTSITDSRELLMDERLFGGSFFKLGDASEEKVLDDRQGCGVFALLDALHCAAQRCKQGSGGDQLGWRMMHHWSRPFRPEVVNTCCIDSRWSMRSARSRRSSRRESDGVGSASMLRWVARSMLRRVGSISLGGLVMRGRYPRWQVRQGSRSWSM